MTRAEAIAELKRLGVPESEWTTPPAASQEHWAYENIARPFARTGKAVAKGAVSLGDLPYVPVNAARSYFGAQPLKMPSELVGETIDEYGGELVQPRNDFERKLDKATEFAAGLASGAPLAKVGKMMATGATAKVLESLAPQGAQDLGAALGAGYLSEAAHLGDPNSAMGPLVAGLAGGALGAGATQSIKGGLAHALQINPNKVAAFQDAEIAPTIADISNSSTLAKTQNYTKDSTLVGKSIERAMDKAQDDIAMFFEKEGISTPITQGEAGEIAQTSLRNWQDTGFKKAGKLAAKMQSHIQNDSPIQIGNTLEKIATAPDFATPEARRSFGISAVGQKYRQLQNIAARHDGAVPYADLVQLRDDVTDSITTFGTKAVGKKEQGKLKDLYGAIQKDIGHYFDSVGPEAKQDFERHNKFYTAFAKHNEQVVSKLLKDKTATETFQDIVRNQRVDGRKAQAILSKLNPEERKVFSASLIRELGMTSENDFAATVLSKKFRELEPEVQNIVLDAYPSETRAKFKNVLDVVDNIQNTAKAGSSLPGIIPGFQGVLQKSMGFLSSKLFASPKFINWLADAQSIKNPAEAEKHIGVLASIVKTSPYLATDISRYIDGMRKEEEPQEQMSAGPMTEDLSALTPEQARSMLKEQGIDWETGDFIASPVQEQTQDGNNILDKIGFIESGNNPNARNPNSTASGSYQFINSTWKEMVQKYGAETGITLRDKKNPQAQRIMAGLYMQENIPKLRGVLGREPTAGEIYLAHFMGGAGAVKLLRNMGSKRKAASLFPEEARANKSIFFANGQPRTVEEVYEVVTRKV